MQFPREYRCWVSEQCRSDHLIAEVMAGVAPGGPDRRGARRARTGSAAAECSRIRNADFGRYTLFRLMKLLAAGERGPGMAVNRRVTVTLGLALVG